MQGKFLFSPHTFKMKVVSHLVHVGGAEPLCQVVEKSPEISKNPSSAQNNIRKVTICMFLLCRNGLYGGFPQRI